MTEQSRKVLPDWTDLIRQALTVWTVGAGDDNSLESLSVIRSRMGDGNLHTAINRLMEDALKLLETRSPQYAQLLRLRFREKEMVRVVANRLSLAESSVYRIQRDAVESLAEIVMEMEASVRETMASTFEARLEPPTYFELVGVEGHIEELTDVLTSERAPWIVAIEGMGGTGKTALADALIRRLIYQTSRYSFAWTTARQGSGLGVGLQAATLPALSTDDVILSIVNQLWGETEGKPSAPSDALKALEYKLKSLPHLVVIDNLETISDVEVLLPVLRRLAKPSKFLLTSRESLFTETDIFHYPLPPLSLEDSITLVRQEADKENLANISQLPDRELKPIYDVVGGNPLALLLVVGQCHIRPLSTVLADLLEARGYRTEQLYTHIFWNIWEHLDGPSRNVLMAMQLVPPRGEDQDFIVGVTDLQTEEVMDVIEKLMILNLVDCNRERETYRYSIHSLTRSFLHQQAVKWLNDSRL